MDVKTFLLTKKESIGCTGCGNCCADCGGPSKCDYKNPSGLCEVHPTLVGDAVATALRKPECSLSPVEIAVELKFACPPVADVIEAVTGVRVAVDDSFSFTGAKIFNLQQLQGVLKIEI
ncbi:hypothetical protein A2160_00955 [Candidatus Beckwithbacteria bacterium RBG_13_42_9]|uniref:Uncharacterized protein n=1 Tax=Candidatus Beckwithbacteria bacterium RBG_13_42_9 TaxID=1797457 RepID=A0A1F5E3G9_9BACT|nr:MAG: hypothetical protein A2160_00955 [Candidatus Beckwithbacteria bacterium RBG_13_42_9]